MKHLDYLWLLTDNYILNEQNLDLNQKLQSQNYLLFLHLGEPMNIPKVSVKIKPDSIAPKKAYTCHEPPIHWISKAQKVIQ